jgi:hypothetical protein
VDLSGEMDWKDRLDVWVGGVDWRDRFDGWIRRMNWNGGRGVDGWTYGRMDGWTDGWTDG